MRYTVPLLLFAWTMASPVLAQQRKPPEITKVHVGFQTYQREDHTAYKIGLWTPIYIEVSGGTEGAEPPRINEPPHLEIESQDSDDVGTIIRVPVALKPQETRTFMTYVKSGRQLGSNEITVRLQARGGPYKPVEVLGHVPLEVDAHLYLTLGPKVTELNSMLLKLGKEAKDKEKENAVVNMVITDFRHVVYENKVERLPESWFGYNGIDLIVLSTDSGAFLLALKNDPKRLAALAQWVRRGGRLIVPVAHENQQAAADLLRSPVWDPPIPATPSKGGEPIKLKRLTEVEEWGRVRGDAFQVPQPNDPLKLLDITVANLDDGRGQQNWDVEADTGKQFGNRPLIAHVRYGLGQITYLAFSLEDANFLKWQGKGRFLQTMIERLAPRAPGDLGINDRFGRNQQAFNDVSTDLLAALDSFDVTVIPFSLVALFIVLYIVVVGPLDFVLLKYVFKRLEWTWVTFPVVVLTVSVVAYFAAYALKGRDLKVNKIDIVDFDLRTDPKNVHAYGSSFFTILSPRIQNYTVGVEPNPEFWGDKAEKVRSADLVSWMGRPSGGPNAMDRGGSGGFFRKPYSFREDASGLEGVPIPVWTTKAFMASWEQALKDTPFKVDLVYHKAKVRGRELTVTGTIENRLAVDLVDVWLIYLDHCYEVPQGLKTGAAAKAIEIEAGTGKDFAAWVGIRDGEVEPRVWKAEPTTLVKKLLFHERDDTQLRVRNHLLRPLDQGWRVLRDKDRDLANDRRPREAILFARVRHVTGEAEAVTRDAQTPLPTKLWLGDIPDPGKRRPELSGQLNQDTYIRAILPVRPAAE